MSRLDQYELQRKLDQLSITGEKRDVSEAVVMFALTKKEDELTEEEFVVLRSVVDGSSWELDGLQYDYGEQLTYAKYER